ncbi:hypothetical protein MUK42_09149 [Musa troglodytarum]|uniref:Uncharacterized protein n=1 Tax=Musa troglodytarum TaxID=320322 RepID=A0A9E7I866_9LILI|nr:hypothetical protein MUK42_09149 [Musa troglodytarum]
MLNPSFLTQENVAHAAPPHHPQPMQRSASYQPLQTQGRQMEVVTVLMAPANVNPSSSCVTAPPSPRHPLGYCGYRYYTSAPTSPSRAAVVYPAEASDFAFCFGGQSEGEKPTPALATADELFEEGMIRPLMLPPRRSCSSSAAPVVTMETAMRRDRGRALLPTSSAASSNGGRGSRSLSPWRGGEEEDDFLRLGEEWRKQEVAVEGPVPLPQRIGRAADGKRKQGSPAPLHRAAASP